MSSEKQNAPFWETTPLGAMSRLQWENLCDGCGKCCLIKLEDDDTGEVYSTDVHCRLFDNDTCRCRDYANRKTKVPDCVILKPESIAALKWMPRSCAYRRIHEGRGLPEWHYLVSGDRDTIHEAGMSVRHATVSEIGLSDEEQSQRITVWPGEAGWDDNDDSGADA